MFIVINSNNHISLIDPLREIHPLHLTHPIRSLITRARSCGLPQCGTWGPSSDFMPVLGQEHWQEQEYVSLNLHQHGICLQSFPSEGRRTICCRVHMSDLCSSQAGSVQEAEMHLVELIQTLVNFQ